MSHHFLSEFEKEFTEHGYKLNMPIFEDDWNHLYSDQFQNQQMSSENIWMEIETYIVGQIISRCKDLDFENVCLFLDQLAQFVQKAANFSDSSFTEPLFKQPYSDSYPLCQGLCSDFEIIVHSLEKLLYDETFSNITRDQLHTLEIVQKLDKILIDSGKYPNYSLLQLYQETYLSENDSSSYQDIISQLLQMMDNDETS